MPNDIGFVDNSVQLAHYAMLEKIKDQVTAAGQGWTVLRYDDTVDNRELILEGEGLTGEERIYVGFRTYQSVDADYYNLVVASFTGYLEAESFDSQPQAILSGIPAHNQRIDYWLSWNAQHIKFALKVGTPVYESAYVGKFLPYARPSQFPHPIVNCGMLDGTPATRFSDTSHSIPYKGNRANMRMRNTDGSWIQPHCYPYNNAQLAGSATALRDTGSQYHLMPVELYASGLNIYGALEGIFFVSGFDNTVENLIVIDGIEYIVIQDVGRNGFRDYYAIRMDA